MVRMNFIFNLINLAAVEKTNRKNIIELQYCTGMNRRDIQLWDGTSAGPEPLLFQNNLWN